MKIVVALLLVCGIVVPAVAGEPVTRTLPASSAKVWTTTLAVLKQLGWDIDKTDQSIGWITTDSRNVEGEDYGVYAKGTRHRLTIHVRAAGETRSTVSVERAVFKRERILWMDKDEPLVVKDQDVEKSILNAIEKSL